MEFSWGKITPSRAQVSVSVRAVVSAVICQSTVRGHTPLTVYRVKWQSCLYVVMSWCVDDVAMPMKLYGC